LQALLLLKYCGRRNGDAAGRSQSAFPLNEDLTRCSYLLPNIN
jgi:hypothetical protein